MYRLLSARNIYNNSVHNLALPNNNCLLTQRILENGCLLCRNTLLGCNNTVAEKIVLMRHQSTKTAVHKSKKKVKYRNPKKYGELLQVSSDSMTEMKVSINKLRADHLSKLASSSLSLGQLHQLTKKRHKHETTKEVDPELLQSVKNKLLNNKSPKSPEIYLQDDKCALIFTSQTIDTVESRFRSNIDSIRESYINFKNSTLYDQRLQDLRGAINQGLTQEFDMMFPHNGNQLSDDPKYPPVKGAHAVFKEMFYENELDTYGRDLVVNLRNVPSISNPMLDDILEESTELAECNDLENIEILPGTLTKKQKNKQQHKAKKKAQLSRRLAQQQHMKEPLSRVEARGVELALQTLLAAHLQLLSSLHMLHEGRQVLQHYRSRGKRGEDQPRITDVKVYNILIHGYAAQGKRKEALEVMSLMEEDGITPNPQTFAALFESVERSGITDKIPALKQLQHKMNFYNITLNDLLDKCKFLYDQRSVTLEAVRRISPDFQPQYTPPTLDYTCPLLQDLNLDQIHNRQGLLKSPAEGLMTVPELIEKGKEQLELEIKGEIELKNISVEDNPTPKVLKYREILEKTESEWRTTIREAFIRNLGTLKSQSNATHSPITIYPYLKVLQVDEVVQLMMAEINKLVDGSESFSPTLSMLQRELGLQVYNRYKIGEYHRNGVLDKMKMLYSKYCEWYLNREPLDPSLGPLNNRQAWQMLMHQYRDGASLDIEETPWPIEIRQNIGKFLYNIIINDIKIDVNMLKNTTKVKHMPAVYRVHRPWGRLVRLEIKPHPALVRAAAAACRPALRMRASLLPTCAPPSVWSAYSDSAYLITDTPLVRMQPNVSQQWKRLKDAPPASLYPALDSLNQLGEVPWKINQRILDLQIQIFRSGGNKKLDIPPPPRALDASRFPAGDGKAAAFRRRLAVSRARAEMYSLWCDALYKLALANHYRSQTFWLPHNVDFRGRVYACPPHLSALGADAARAVLRFAVTHPLGKDGLRWLLLHVVNLTGTKKNSTIEQRLEYANSVMEDILDSADNPLEGRGWWMESEEPWQTLACCMEIANAVRSPNPEEYECGFPVHQDGSCNGLQHYAALGGDAAGAAAVNLAALNTPADVYTATAARVEEMRQADAEKGSAEAIALEGFVRRKVIKQTVMTTVYGVTRFGARLQIAKQLKDIEEFPKELVWSCSHYLTSRTFDSLREMFTSTKMIQDWFVDCAKVISGVCGESVEWTTPLGLPVVQPYFHKSTLSNAPGRAPLDHAQRPCTSKQRNAFPPNFIHSLDSSHMMLTSLRCQTAPLAFVSVHDCFWTHPHTVHHMNKICREQFVALHSQPILKNLSEFLVKRYSYNESEIQGDSPGASEKRRANELFKKVPEKGDFELKKVLDSVYFFS